MFYSAHIAQARDNARFYAGLAHEALNASHTIFGSVETKYKRACDAHRYAGMSESALVNMRAYIALESAEMQTNELVLSRVTIETLGELAVSYDADTNLDFDVGKPCSCFACRKRAENPETIRHCTVINDKHFKC